MDKISYGLEELRSAVVNAGLIVPTVSKWSVGMHIHHCCLSMLGISRRLGDSNPPAPNRKSSLAASMVFASGRIPRGRSKAPDTAIPRADVTRPELLKMLEECQKALVQTEVLDPEAWFEHFFFGVLKRDQALTFLRMHNRHHLDIISDLKKA